MKKIRTILLLVLLLLIAPLALQAQTVESFTFTTNRLLPDGNLSGLSDVQTVNSGIGTITSLKVRLKITGEFNGDLYAYLRHSGGFTVLLNRPGRTALNPFGYSDSGFDVTFQDDATNGDIHNYQTVTTPVQGSPLTGIWQPDGRNVDPDVVDDTSPRTTWLTNFNGLSASGTWTLYLVDTQSGATNMLTEWGLDITGVPAPAINWSNPADIVYGTPLSETQLNASAVYNSTNVPGTFTYTPPLDTVLNAGPNQTLSATFTPTDTSTFAPVTSRVTINVQKAPLTVTAVSTNKIYGSPAPPFTATYSGFVTGEDTNNLSSLAIVTTTAVDSSDVGAYPITASGASSTNYSFTYVDGTLAITQALSSSVVISSANPALPGASVTFTATLSAVAPGAGTPTGTVNFVIDGSVAGSGALSGGIATFTISSLTHGPHSVTAEYVGSLDFVGTANSLAASQVINTPPVAAPATIERYPTEGTKVLLSTLLTNDSDPDGDTLSAVVSSTSANGGTVTVSDGWVIYTPPAGFTNTDSFTYTVSDEYGGNAVGTVTVAINSDDEPTANLSITPLSNNVYLIDGSGIPGRTYHLQYSDSVAPFNWQDMTNGSLTADELGSFQYTDTSTGAMRMYRTVTP